MEFIGVDERAEGESRVARLLRAEAEGEDGLVRIFTAKSEEAFGGVDSNLVAIDSGLDPDDDSLRVVVGNMIDCLLDSLEIARTIRGNNDVFGTGRNHIEAQKTEEN